MTPAASPTSKKGSAKSPAKGAQTGGAKKSPPTSSLKTGSANKSDRKKDCRNPVHCLGFGDNFLAAFSHKPGKPDIASFTAPSLGAMKLDADMCADIGVCDVFSRSTGPASNAVLAQSKNSSYPWDMAVIKLSSSANTPGGRKKKVEELIKFVNTKGAKKTKQNKHVTVFKLGEDRTANPPVPADDILLDIDIITILNDSYPDHSLEELATFPEVVSLFFSDTERGVEVLNGDVAEPQQPVVVEKDDSDSAAGSDED